jgi:hypothetical protein
MTVVVNPNLRPADQVAPVDVDERVPLLFDFANMDSAATEVAGTPALSCEAIEGTDPNASGCVESPPQVSGLQVAVWFSGVEPGVVYLVRCVATLDTGAVLTRAMKVPALRVGGGE